MPPALQAIDSFVATAEAKFGPITIIRREGKVVKKIPWSAFRLEEDDWRRVALCVDILAVRHFPHKPDTDLITYNFRTRPDISKPSHQKPSQRCTA